MALADTAQLAVKLTLDDRAFTGPLSRVQRNLGGLNKNFYQVGRGIGQLGAGFARVGYIAAAAVGGGLIAAAKAGADFEAQLRTINTIAREDAGGLTIIGDGLRQLAREGRGNLADLSQGYYDILSAGISAADAQGVLTSATTLAIGGLSTNAQAVDLLTTAINAYGQEASAAQADADLFAKSIELGKVTADEIAASFASVAPIAAQQKIEIEEVAAAYAALTAQGVPAAEVTTQMQRAIIELLSPGADLIALQKELGVSFLQIAQDDGLVVALQAMRDAVGGDEEAFKALFGRVEGYKFALQTTGPQNEIYNNALREMGLAAGTASEQMGERQQGLAFAVNRLKANLVDAGIQLSTGFLPALTRAADKLSEFLGSAENREQLTQLGRDIGEIIDGIDFNKVAAGAKAFLGIVKSVWAILSKIPVEIHAAVLAFAGLNRLSGGLIGAGIGNIVGGLAGAGATGLAARAPGLGKLFAQPVFVTNWPIGGLGGTGGGVAGAAKGGIGAVGKMFLVGEAIGLAMLIKEVADNVTTAAREQAVTIGQTLNQSLTHPQTPQDLLTKLAGVEAGIKQINSLGNIPAAIFHDTLVELEGQRALIQAAISDNGGMAYTAGQAKDAREDSLIAPLVPPLNEIAKNTRDAPDKTTRRQAGAFARLKARIDAHKVVTQSGNQKTSAGLMANKGAVNMAKTAIKAGAANDASRIIAAVRAARPIISVIVNAATNYTTVVKTGQTMTKSSSDPKSKYAPQPY